MERTLDMQFIRYLNLFEKVTRITTQHCFSYNSAIIFVVAPQLISKAIGENGKNIKKLSEIMEKKVKVIPVPRGREDMHRFISLIIQPIRFNSLEITNDSVIINAGRQNKAALIGRDKRRLNEMANILESYFGIKELRVA